MEKIVSEYAAKNGFTPENRHSLESINETLKAMKLNAFLENKDSFIQMEPKLGLLYNYAIDGTSGFNSQKFVAAQKSCSFTIGDLIACFCKEPDESKVAALQSEYDRAVGNLVSKSKEIEIAIERLKETDKYLFETDICFKYYEIPETAKALTPQSSGKRNVSNPVDIENIIKTYCPDEYRDATHIILCPFCKGMFAQTLDAAYQYANQAANSVAFY